MSVNPEILKLRQSPNTEESTVASESSQAAVARLVGITAINMMDTIQADIESMIDEGLRMQLDGYIFCLSRIVSHKKAWYSISQAFHNKGEKVPHKYKQQFIADDIKSSKKGTVSP